MKMPDYIISNSDKLALVSTDAEFTYTELNKTTSALAAEILLLLGKGPEPVLVYTSFGLWFTICSLALWKAGKIPVQISTNQEPARIAIQMNRVPSRLMLTTEDHIPEVLNYWNKLSAIFNLDSMHDSLYRGGSLHLEGGIWRPEQSFIEFTSGTTGKPKTVAHTHQTELNLAIINARNLGVNPTSRVAQLRGGISGYQNMALALLNGATLVVRAEDEQRDYATWANDNQVTVMPMLGSTFHYMMSIKNPELTTVEIVEVGGEMLHYDDLADFKAAFADSAVFVNRYSCTETRVVARYAFNKLSSRGEGRLPVGRPIDRVKVTIVDEKKREVPAGNMGEIVVLSPYLADGYLDDPQQTAAKFTPLGYMTGDLGYIDKGVLFHAGRKDFQGQVRAKFNAAKAETDSLRLDRNINTTIGSL